MGFMLEQTKVDKWLANFLKRLRKSFKDRLIFVGHHGSWARGEPKPESDIDTIVVLDHIDAHDLNVFRDIIFSMPDANLASGALFSIFELQAWPPYDLLQLFYGCKTLYGTFEGLIKKPTTADIIECIKVFASTNLHHARHYLLFPHEFSKVVHNLKYPFKNCFYALQYWILLTENKYIPRKNDLIKFLKEKDDKKAVIVARDWKELEDDRTRRPLYYIKLLERWSRKMLMKLRAYESK